jgi:hypothetical protein
MICCVFAAAAIEPLGIAIERTPVLGWIVFFPKGMPLTILGTIILIALPYTIKPMHPQRVGHKHAGLWLAERIQKDDWLIDPLSWGEWYAGRTLYKTPVCHGTPEFVWVIIEKKSSSPHSRLPLWNLAKEITVQHDPFYRWPADAPKDGPAIEVYRLRFVDVPNLRERLQAANQPPTQTSSH